MSWRTFKPFQSAPAQNTFQAMLTPCIKSTNYCNSGDLPQSLRVLEKMTQRNQATWNALLITALESNQLNDARQLFEEMPYKNSASYTSMISGLSKLGFVSKAREVFDSIPVVSCNVISWTAMISCYSKNDLHFEALKFFSERYGDFYELKVLPNSYTFSTVLKSCLEMGSLPIAMQIRGLIMKLLDENDEKSVYVQNALIDLYSKLGCLADAQKIFNGLKWKDLSSWNIMMAAYAHHQLIDKGLAMFQSMPEKDTLSWNILISGFAESGRGNEALELFVHQWQSPRSKGQDIRPNPSTFTIIVTVCATFCMLEWGRLVHACTVKFGLYENNIFIGNSLINMYARCGLIDQSERVFNEMPRRDVVSWNSLALCLGQNGYFSRALQVAEKALEYGFYNHITFIGMLTSCSHGGLVDEGLNYFSSISKKYGINPSLDHYICVIDMLGRAGRIDEAHNLLHKMPFEANAVTWATLLSACVLHGNEELGELAAQKLKDLEPNNVTTYVLLANMYGQSGKTNEYKRVLNLMNDIGLKKEQCHSWIL